jgi:hypothetical protein
MNNQFPTIKFTIEKENNKELAFLDVLVKRNNNNNKLSTTVYRKKTDSGRYLNYKSNHPPATKQAIASTLFHRAMTHCSSERERKREEEKIIDTLVCNNYPRAVIHKARSQVREREKGKEVAAVVAGSSSSRGSNVEEREKPYTTISIPYLPGLSEKIKKLGYRKNIRIVFNSNTTLRQDLVHLKPKNINNCNKNCIYSIPCSCGQNYIGETGRPLQIRINEHKNYVNNPRRYPNTKIVEHLMNKNLNEHIIKWDETIVIGREKKSKKRKVQEAIEITKNKSTTFSQCSHQLDEIWLPIIKKEMQVRTCRRPTRSRPPDI